MRAGYDLNRIQEPPQSVSKGDGGNGVTSTAAERIVRCHGMPSKAGRRASVPPARFRGG